MNVSETAQTQRHGRLTVFLGAAPGTGKTAVMLRRARTLQQKGLDVVIGAISTHTCAQTQQLTTTFPVFTGNAPEAMDIAAILQERPALVLAGNLAHRNLSGARFTQRWQEVETLLAAGIDVYATMNIQHLASLSDTVYQMTDIREHDTVPDTLFEHLHDICLVDVPMDDYLERAANHAPSVAASEMSAAHLNALRILAMQTAADFLDVDAHITRTAGSLSGITLQSLRRHLSKAVDLKQVMQAGCDALQTGLHVKVWMQIGQESTSTPRAPALSDTDLQVAAWARQQGQSAGYYTGYFRDCPWWFLPVRADQEILGVVGILFDTDTQPFTFEQYRLAEDMIDDIAQTALRTRLTKELEAAKIANETERLRSALLSSVSHDLRSPLAAMIGAADSLANYRNNMSAADQQSLLNTIHIEGERLDRYIQNLLDMTRLGQEGLTLARDWIGIDELIGSATRRLQRYVPHVTYSINIPANLPPVHVHPALIEQAIFNVLENAAKFSPPGEPLDIAVRQTDNHLLEIAISDKGPGIPESERLRIFDMFYSVERGDRGKNGTGLGLAIVQGIVGAHMGTVKAFPGKHDQGTLITMTLPWGQSPTSKESLDDHTA
jgi:K+-sensing histidine kinase KdpD